MKILSRSATILTILIGGNMSWSEPAFATQCASTHGCTAQIQCKDYHTGEELQFNIEVGFNVSSAYLVQSYESSYNPTSNVVQSGAARALTNCRAHVFN